MVSSLCLSWLFNRVYFGVEKERQRQAEKARKEDERRRDERRKMESKNKKMNQLDSSAEESFKDDSVAKQEFTTTAASAKPRQPVGDKIKAKSVKEEIVKKDKVKEKKVKEDLPPYVDAQAVQHMQDRPKVAHAQNHQIAHNEAVMRSLSNVVVNKTWIPFFPLFYLAFLCVCVRFLTL